MLRPLSTHRCLLGLALLVAGTTAARVGTAAAPAPTPAPAPASAPATPPAADVAAEVDQLMRAAQDLQQRGLMKRALETVSEAIRLSPKDPRPVYLRATFHQRMRQWLDADGDLTQALTLAPAEPSVLFERGIVRLRLGHFTACLDDLDRFLELRPSRAPGLWQRGIALFYANRPDDGRRQFELHRVANPSDVENSAWHFACLARLVGADAARARWMKVEGDSRIPMAQIQELFLGTGTPEDVEAAAAQVVDPARRTEAEFYARLYLSLYYGSVGQREPEARYAARAAEIADDFGIMGDIARHHAKWVAARLRQPRTDLPGR